jgi:hypothetical protein
MTSVRKLGSLVAGVALVFACAACGGGSSSTADVAPTTTGDVPGTATIRAFDVPRTVSCGATPSTTVQVQYATKGADRQEVIVDGRVVPGTETAKGSVAAPVHCDPLEHTVVLVAYDSNGRRTAETKFLHTELPGSTS